MLFSNKKNVITEKRVVLKKINWSKFTEILNELGRDRTVHLTYDRGRLEMITPLEIHDRTQRLLDSLLLVIADESGETLHGLGSVLLIHPEEGLAIQPFAAYYLDYPAKPVSSPLDVSQIAPPDLVIDVTLDDGNVNRSSIFEAFQIPEVWHYRAEVTEGAVQGKLEIFQYTSSGYVASRESLAFPMLGIARIQEFIAESDTLGLSKALTVLRSWASQNQD